MIIRRRDIIAETVISSSCSFMAMILVKCEGNDSPKYDGKNWKEELKFVVSVNGVTVDLHERKQPESESWRSSTSLLSW